MRKRILTSAAFVVFAISSVASAQDRRFFPGTWENAYSPPHPSLTKLVFYDVGSGYYVWDGQRTNFRWRVDHYDGSRRPVVRLYSYTPEELKVLSVEVRQYEPDDDSYDKIKIYTEAIDTEPPIFRRRLR
jgi:hypothetical protein